jgi:hypothetical protein
VAILNIIHGKTWRSHMRKKLEVSSKGKIRN